MGTSYLLYDQLGLPSAVAFNMMWWSWCDDLGFYGWANAIDPPRPPGSEWENRDFNGLKQNHITWAYWTPIGLLRPKGAVIARDALIGQAAVGATISIAQLW